MSVRILVSNDDGVESPGLWAVVAAVRDLGDVFVVAPDREQSGIGTSVTLQQIIRASVVKPEIEGVPTYKVEGTPADSVILALEMLVGTVDLVISGINQGANVGEDVLVSGTVGAALQGYVRRINSIAVSVTATVNVHNDAAAQVVRQVAQRLGTRALPEPLFLNINLPNLPMDKLKGIDVTTLGRRSWLEVVKEGDDGRRKYYWIHRNKPAQQDAEVEGTDVWSVRHDRISLTPLTTRLTFQDAVDPLRAVAADMNLVLFPGVDGKVGAK